MILPTSFLQYFGSLSSHVCEGEGGGGGDGEGEGGGGEGEGEGEGEGGGESEGGGSGDGGEGGGNGKSNGVEAVETPTSLAAVATKSREKRSFIVPAHGQEEEETCGSQATCDARGWACVMPECVDRVVARR